MNVQLSILCGTLLPQVAFCLQKVSVPTTVTLSLGSHRYAPRKCPKQCLASITRRNVCLLHGGGATLLQNPSGVQRHIEENLIKFEIWNIPHITAARKQVTTLTSRPTHQSQNTLSSCRLSLDVIGQYTIAIQSHENETKHYHLTNLHEENTRQT